VEEGLVIACPYCGETLELYLESDVKGTLIQDCEVCCNPYSLRIWNDGDERHVSVARADGSE
jgi:hypothetical protein